MQSRLWRCRSTRHFFWGPKAKSWLGKLKLQEHIETTVLRLSTVLYCGSLSLFKAGAPHQTKCSLGGMDWKRLINKSGLRTRNRKLLLNWHLGFLLRLENMWTRATGTRCRRSRSWRRRQRRTPLRIWRKRRRRRDFEVLKYFINNWCKTVKQKEETEKKKKDEKK